MVGIPKPRFTRKKWENVKISTSHGGFSVDQFDGPGGLCWLDWGIVVCPWPRSSEEVGKEGFSLSQTLALGFMWRTRER